MVQFPDRLEASGVFVERGRLLVATLFDAITTTVPLAVHPSGDVWLYDGGRYRYDRQRLAWLGASRLGDSFKPDHLRNFVAYAAARLHSEGRVLSAQATTSRVNVANGMLDPFTGELVPHDPSYLSIVQLPVAWDRAATCPTFDRWLADVMPDADRRAV